MKLDTDTYTRKQVRSHTARVLETVLGRRDVKTATAYPSPKLTVKLTRQRRPDRRDRQETFVLTVGSPNYLERIFVKDCQKAGEKFPVRNIQLKFYPARKK